MFTKQKLLTWVQFSLVVLGLVSCPATASPNHVDPAPGVLAEIEDLRMLSRADPGKASETINSDPTSVGSAAISRLESTSSSSSSATPVRLVDQLQKAHYYDKEQVQLIKDHNLCCLSMFVGPRRFQILSVRRKNRQKRLLEGCLALYDKLIETRMYDQLGEVGGAIFEWFSIISKLLNELDTADKLAVLLAVKEPKKLANLAEAVAETLARVTDYPVEHHYIEQTYATGAGVCPYLPQPPFGKLIQNVLKPLFEVYLGEQQQPSPTRRLFFASLGYLGEPVDEASGQYSSLTMLFLLNDLCEKLASSAELDDATLRPPPPATAGDSQAEELKQQKDFVSAGLLRLASAEPSCSDPKWLTYVRDLYRVQAQLAPSDELVVVSSQLEAASNLFAEKCLTSEQEIVDMSKLGVQFDLSDAILTESVIKQIDTELQRSHGQLAEGSSMLDLLHFRDSSEQVSELEMVFFKQDDTTRLQTFWKMITYTNGGGLCEPYKRLNVYEHHNLDSPLLKAMEFMNQLLSIPRFHLRLSNKLTDHYYMWKICESLALVKLHLPEKMAASQ